MRRRFAAVVFVLQLTSLALLRAAAECPQIPQPLSLLAYQEELRGLEQRLGETYSESTLKDIASCLPEEWKVETGSAQFQVRTWAIKQDIQNIITEKDEEERSEEISDLQSSLRSMREQASSYNEQSYVAEREQLSEILAKPEYRHVTGPGWQERLEDWIKALLYRLLGRVIGQIPGMLTFLRLVAWGLVLLGLALLMRYLFHWLKQSGAGPVIPDQLAISARHWTDWRGQAEQAAKAGDWRGAIHFAYWAAISYLEQQGHWAPDRARTPREYLRLIPQDGERRDILLKLTRKFEYVWYAQNAANQNDYLQSLQELEALGCR